MSEAFISTKATIFEQNIVQVVWEQLCYVLEGREMSFLLGEDEKTGECTNHGQTEVNFKKFLQNALRNENEELELRNIVSRF